MEIKAILNKPNTEKQRLDFIVANNYNLGYEIKETDIALEAWGNTNEEDLAQAKENKYSEALTKAQEYINSGNALYEFQEGKHIEATDGNIAKMTSYALGFLSGTIPEETTVSWNTKEDENVELTSAQVADIAAGLGAIQSYIWTDKFARYKAEIDAAETVEEVKGIVIEYSLENTESEKL